MRDSPNDDLEEVRAGLRASVENLCRDLLGKPSSRTGGEWRWGRKGSLSVAVAGIKRGLWHDHEGGTGGDLLDLIRRERGSDFPAALDWARGFLGIADGADWRPHERKAKPENKAKRAIAAAEEDAVRRGVVDRYWRDTVPIAGTVAERYLVETRKIPSPSGGWPAAAVRFHPGRCALVVAATTAAGEVQSVQFVHLTAEGTKREEDGRPTKQSFGPQEGAAVRLPGEASALLLAEGPETGLSAWAASGRETWIALGSIAKVQPPPLRRLCVCADDDQRDKPAAKSLGKAIGRWRTEGRHVAIALPWARRRFDGSDFNDVLRHDGLEAVRARIEAAIAPPPPPPLEPHYPAPENTRAEALEVLGLEVGYFFDRAAAHVSAVETWRKGRAAVDQVWPPKSPGRRAALRAARAEMAAVHGPDWQKPGARLLLPAAAGSGKTKLTAAAIAARLPELGRVNFYTDTLDNACSVASKIPTAEVVRGRSAIDPRSPDGARMCRRYKAAEAVAFAGLPVGQTLCRDPDGRTCPLFSGCAYQRAAADRREGTGVSVGSSEYLVLRGGMSPPDVVVIDEDCVGRLIGHVEFGADRLLPAEMPEWHAGGLAAATAYRSFMQLVAEAVQDPAGILAGLRSRGIGDAAAFTPAVAFLRAVEEREYTFGITPTMDDAAVLERLERHARSEIHAVLKMLLALREEIAAPRDQAHGVAFHPDKPVMVDGQQERQNRISVHYRKDLAFRADVPVLVLDASGDAEIYRQLLGDRLTAAAAVQCERNVEVVQVRDATLPRSSLLGTDRRGDALSDTSPARAERLRAEMVATANALAAKHGDLFMLATNMAVETAITAELAEVGVTEAVLTGHFGRMRGRNDYEHCTAGMVLGRNQPPASAMEAMARAIWANDPEPLNLSRTYGKANRGIRLRDGSAVPIEVDVHSDPRVQRVLELHRERESEQAIDRLRLIHNEKPKTLYLACNLPLNVTVDRIVTRRALVHEATGRVDNGQEGKGRRIYGNRLVEAYRLGGGILPLSRAELVRLSADETSVLKGFWQSERAARNDGIDMAVSAIRTLLAETATSHPLLVSYRLQGQGRPSKALISPEIPDGRAVLQALLGRPIVAYDVEDDPEPPEPPSAPRPPPPSQEPPPSPQPQKAEPMPTETVSPEPCLTDQKMADLPDQIGLPPGAMLRPVSAIGTIFAFSEVLTVRRGGQPVATALRDRGLGVDFLQLHSAPAPGPSLRPAPSPPDPRLPMLWRRRAEAEVAGAGVEAGRAG